MKNFFLLGGVLSTVALAALAFYSGSGFGQHVETSTFNQTPVRPPEDPAVVAHGKAAYEKYCQSCHSADMRGTETNPNLLRSQDALIDRHGEQLIPIMRGQSAEFPDHKTDIGVDDAEAVAAYVRTLLAQIGSQGRPPGDALRQPDILVGSAVRGQQYFAKMCASCHSATGDLKGFASRVPSPKLMQAAWLRGTYLGAKTPSVTVAVTAPNQHEISGTLLHIDDFLVTVKTNDGSTKTLRRDGALPKVILKDPLEAHRLLLPRYTDDEMHDITAYLASLK